MKTIKLFLIFYVPFTEFETFDPHQDFWGPQHTPLCAGYFTTEHDAMTYLLQMLADEPAAGVEWARFGWIEPREVLAGDSFLT